MQTQTLLADEVSTSTVPAPPFPYPYLRIDDRTRLFYRDWPGRASGKSSKTVLFVSSWALNADMWQYQMLHLANQNARVLAYDRRGHGRSTDPGTGYDYDTFADDLASVIEQLDLRDLVLVGHSMGCGEIVRYLSRHGDSRVSKVVMIGAALPFIKQTPDNPQGVPGELLRQTRDLMSTNFPKWLQDNAPAFLSSETAPRVFDWIIDMCQQPSLAALIETNRAVVETDFRPELLNVRRPVLVIHGDRDVSAPLDFTAVRTKELLPNANLAIYEDGPHGLFITHMARLNQDLTEFIFS